MSFKSSLYFSPLSDVAFTNIFSMSVIFVIVLLLSFVKEKLFCFNNYKLLINNFMNCVFGIVSKSHHHTDVYLKFSPEWMSSCSSIICEMSVFAPFYCHFPLSKISFDRFSSVQSLSRV